MKSEIIEKKTLSVDDSVKLLVEKCNEPGETKVVLLFPDSMTMRKISEKISEGVRNNNVVRISTDVPFKAAHNMIKLRNATMYIGLKDQEDLLTEHYPDNSIKYYAEKND